jgi:hypothetical protein
MSSAGTNVNVPISGSCDDGRRDSMDERETGRDEGSILEALEENYSKEDA